jgi:hypothetical protein
MRGQVKAGVGDAIDGFAKRGFRSLGVGRTDAPGHWQCLGVLPLFDPGSTASLSPGGTLLLSR